MCRNAASEAELAATGGGQVCFQGYSGLDPMLALFIGGALSHNR